MENNKFFKFVFSNGADRVWHMICTQDEVELFIRDEARYANYRTCILEGKEEVSCAEYFSYLVEHHDLTYEYSDDMNVYRNGNKHYYKILAVAKCIDDTEAKNIWNSWVDKKIMQPYVEQYYWK